MKNPSSTLLISSFKPHNVQHDDYIMFIASTYIGGDFFTAICCTDDKGENGVKCRLMHGGIVNTELSV